MLKVSINSREIVSKIFACKAPVVFGLKNGSFEKPNRQIHILDEAFEKFAAAKAK